MKWKPERKISFYKNCLTCNKQILVYPYQLKIGRGKFCSQGCHIDSLKIGSTKLTCFGCGNSFVRKIYGHHTRYSKTYCTHSCFMKTNFSLTPYMNKGAKHPFWRGGMGRSITDWALYQDWREAVFKRDNYQCRYCGSKEKLEADHLWSYTFFPKLRVNVNNGQTLCRSCHSKTITYGKKLTKFWRVLTKEQKEYMGQNCIPFEILIQAKKQLLSEEIGSKI